MPGCWLHQTQEDPMFSVASHFDDELPGRVAGMEVDELFGSCDDTPVGHGRPLAMIPPTTWRTLDRHVTRCRTAGLGFNLLLNPNRRPRLLHRCAGRTGARLPQSVLAGRHPAAHRTARNAA